MIRSNPPPRRQQELKQTPPTAGTRVLAWLLCLVLAFPPGSLLPLAEAALIDESAARLPAVEDDSYGFAVADVDGVNGPDVLVAVRGQSRLLMNDGNGVFTDETATRLPVFVQTTLGVAMEDVDGVNGPDIFLAGSGQNRLLINDGSGNFVDESASRLPADLSYSMDLALADIDDDGDLDIYTANRNSQNRLWLNDGSGVYVDATASLLPFDIYASFSVTLADFDGNGTLDAFIANDGQQNRILLNNGLGAFTDNTDFALPPDIARSTDATALDVDADGDLDLAVAEGDAALGLLINDGTGFFSLADPGQLPSLPEYVIRVDSADVDFDGDTDLILGNAGQDRILLNDGAGVFSDGTAAQLPADTRRSFGLAIIDGDSDFDPDLLVATPQGQDRYLDNDIPFPRIRLAVTPDYIEQGDTVSISVEVFDEDGLDGSVSPNPSVEIIQPSSATTQASAAGAGIWTFVPAEIGLHTVRITATDNLGNVGVRETVFLAQAADVTEPTVTVDVDPTTIIQGQSADFSVSATDDRTVVSRSLTVGGVAVKLDVNGNATYAPTISGALEVVGSATDAAGNTGTATTTLQVDPDTLFPVVSLNVSPTTLDITNPITISASATDNIAVESFAVTVTGPSGGPVDEPVPLDSSGNGSYTPFLPGTYTFTATAADPAGNTTVETAQVTAEGIPDAEPPQVSLSVVPGTTIPGGTVTLTVEATDNIFVVSRSLEINGTPVALDASHQAQFTAPVLGDYTAVATATDPTGNAGTDTVVFSAVDPDTDTAAPTVAITSPAQGEQATFLQDFIGTATDLTLVEYSLAYAPSGSGQYTIFATGTQAVEDGLLGTLDTSVLENGLYDIRLRAEDINGLVSEIVQPNVVEGEAKPGLMQVTFVDLNVQVAGIPLAILRTYDSRVKTSEDFGVGWTLDLQEGSVKANRDVGEGWTRQSGGPFGLIFCNDTSEDLYHIVDVRVSDRESYRFRPKVNLDGTTGITGGCPAFVSFEYFDGDLPGATLTIIGSNDLFLPNGQDLTYFPSDPRFGETYNPEAVRLRTIDGREFDFQWDNGRISRIEDSNGNALSITTNGVVHSSGTGVSFTRDAEGRITTVTDANGNDLLYEYDAAGNLSAFVDQEGNRTTYVYDDENNLLEINDPLGNRATLAEYDEAGRLIALTDANGNRTVFSRQIDARQEVVTNALGHSTSYTYDASGNVLLQEQPYTSDGTSLVAITEFGYDENGNRTRFVDPDGVTEQAAYDASGNVLESVLDPGGLNITTAFAYDASGNRTSTTWPTGESLNYSYDASGNPTQLTGPAGGVTELTYGGTGRPTRRVDPTGGIAEMAYDTSGRLTSHIVKASDDTTILSREEWTYNGNGQPLSHTRYREDGSGTLQPYTTSYQYNAVGQKISETDPVGNQTQWEYNPLGRVSAMIDRLGRRTEYTYDAVGALIRTDYPDGTFESMEYDATGNLVATVSREGQRTTYAYDELGRAVAIALPDGTQARKVFSGAGRELASIAPNGERIDYEYDAAGRQTVKRMPEVYDAAADAMVRPVINYEFDAAGTRSAVVDPRGNRTEYTNDFVNRQFTISFPDGSTRTRTLDAGYRLSSVTDDDGNTVEASYDPAGRLVSLTLPAAQVGDPASVYSYDYDLWGNLLAMTDPLGRTTTYEYDALGRLIREVLPSGRARSYAYDAAGNPVEVTDFDGSVTGFTYDARNRLVGRTRSDGVAESLTYRSDGQRQTVTDERGVTTYSYDGQGRLTGVSQPGVGDIDYTWDALGRLASTATASGTTTYGYDELNRLVSVTGTAGETTYGYDRAGNHVSTTYPNGVVTEIDYDAQNRPVRVAHSNAAGTELAAFTYTRAGTGKVTQITGSDGSVETYAYDAQGRLIQESRTGPSAYSRSHEYDLVGNRTQVVADGTTTAFTYGPDNRLLTAGGASLSYDDRGNLVAIDDGGVTTNFAWDALNRLVGVSGPSNAATYQYDFDGRRVAKETAGTETSFLVDVMNPTGYHQVLEERDGGGTLLASYDYGADLITMERSGNTRHYQYDLHGSTRLLTDDTGTVTDSYAYDAYGNLVGATGSTVNDYLYTGEQFDSTAGQYYLRARYYDPALGRFTSRDPYRGDIEDPMSTHAYLYTHADPLNHIDPTGNFTLVGLSISINISSGLRALNTGKKLYSLCKVKEKLEKVEFIWGFIRGLQGSRWGLDFGFGGMNGLGFETDADGFGMNQTLFAVSYEAPNAAFDANGNLLRSRRDRDGIAKAELKFLNKYGGSIPGGGPETWVEAQAATFRDGTVKVEAPITGGKERFLQNLGLGFGGTRTLAELKDKCSPDIGPGFTTMALKVGVSASVSNATDLSLGVKFFLKAEFFGGFADYQFNILQWGSGKDPILFPGW